MNTEQLKTDSELVAKKIISVPDNKPEHAANHKLREITEIVYHFASQESNRAVDEFKDKLKAEILSMRNNRHTATANWTLQEAIDLIDKL